MESLNRFKVSASSLVESIIAMVIIAVCLSIALVVYVNVLRVDKGLPYYAAEQKVKELLWKEVDKPFMEDEVFTYPTYSIQKTVEEIDGAAETYKLTFTVELPNKSKSYEHVVVKYGDGL
ncbi:MAG: hypothetical protein GYB37_15735 [Algicola sp.]|nr:hypothetical protein [Algicola sp.]